MLYHANQPIAEFFGFLVGGVFQTIHTTYDLAFSSYSPGKLLAYLFLPTAGSYGVTTIDFSRGASIFKSQFTPHLAPHYDLIHSPSKVTLLWWRTVFKIITFVETHSTLYNQIRLTKRQVQKIGSMFLQRPKPALQSV